MKYFIVILLLQVIGFYILGFIATMFIALVFYCYMVDKCNLYILPLSILPLPILILPIISLTGMGNFFALSLFNAALLTAFIFTAVTAVLSALLNIRKQAKKLQTSTSRLSNREKQSQELQESTFYTNKKTPHLIMATGAVIIVIMVALAFFGLSVYTTSMHNHQQRILRYTEYTRILEFYMCDDAVAQERANSFRPTALRARISDNDRKIYFETAFYMKLPSINFDEYFFLVLVGEQYAFPENRAWATVRVDPDKITVYQVNIVR